MDGLDDDAVRVRLRGHAGQSFGFALARGVTLEVVGDANDYVGKGLSGGRIVVLPDEDDVSFDPSENVVAGNTCVYGATSGEVFLRGRAGERFAVRNSGANAVVEGVGDHGCEYMTGGRVVVLGPTGRNFAAGMSGGIAYVWDPNNVFPERCNTAMVDLESVLVDSDDEMMIQSLVRSHLDFTQSNLAEDILTNWEHSRQSFVKVMPRDYAEALEKMKSNDDEPVMASE